MLIAGHVNDRHRRRGCMATHHAATAGSLESDKENRSGLLTKNKDIRRANMASQSYEKEEDRADDVMGYDLDRELSSKRTAVYHKPAKDGKESKTIMSFRGTDFKDPKDLYSDAHIVLGTQRNSHEFRKDRADFERVKKKYSGTRVEATGHSLGSQRSASLSRAKGIKSIGFNKGQSVLDKTSWYDTAACKLPSGLKPKYCGKATTHLISGDPLSTSQRLFGNNVVHQAKKGQRLMDRHSMSNFL